MASFVTPAELASYRGETITDNVRAQLILDGVSALIRTVTGQTISQVVGDTLTRRGTRDTEIVLPQRPVTAVASVALDGTALTSDLYGWSENGRLWRTDGGNFGGVLTAVTVTYTHGWAAAADDLNTARAVTLQAASRAWDNPSAVQSESVGDYATVYGINPVGGIMLTEAEKRQLRSAYGRTPRSVEVGT